MPLLLSVILYLLLIPFSFAAKEENYQLKIVYPYKHPIPHQISLENATETVQLQSKSGLLFVSTMLNGKGPYLFWLDTGSEISIISKEVVDDLKLPLLTKTRHNIQASHGSEILTSYLSLAPSLEIGKTTFKNAPFITVDKNHNANTLFTNLGVVGMLGINLFHGITITINFPQKTLSFQKHYVPDKNNMQMNSVYFFPVVSGKVFHNKTEKAYSFLIDTGFNGSIEMPNCNKEKLQNVKTNNSIDFFNNIETGFLSTLNGMIRFGQLSQINPVVRYADSYCKKPRSFGLIGTQFLKDKTLTINLEKRILSIVPAK
ncbi:retroviral-like aspartic protease family protein [Candidatus Berkiella cookevillensis]|uniref:Retroviral-like aspartic protease family protein n=1 Tax=Candidatus Berkiella cookevillensis TaxID=437022 RepID=A0A0Q9YNI8_9GAMM|nr:retropepsin-like aspartic protease [Candidatus Berkiella cookevillensis]MCS5709455.1 retroviral-like aspartic protease family protein [Candidatus Berkiella cookevillensis]